MIKVFRPHAFIFGLIMLLTSVSLIAAEEESFRYLNLRIYGDAVWAPLLYRADMDGLVDTVRGEGAGIGVASSGWGGIGAALGFVLEGRDRGEYIGFALHAIPQISNGNFQILNNTAYIWTQPVNMLKIMFGLYQWDDLVGRYDGIGGVVGGYGGGKNSIFQFVESDTFGAMFILTPPSVVPHALKGLMLFSSFGISGVFDANSLTNYAARAGKLAEFIFSTPHLGLAYRHDSFGLARFQFIGSHYKWGQGIDHTANNTAGHLNIGGADAIHAFYPARVRDAAQIEVAVNVTSIPNINLDVGFGFMFPVTVMQRDGIFTDVGVPVGPSFRELDYRQRLPAIDNRRLAEFAGDVWQPPARIGAALVYTPENIPLRFHFQTRMEFGEQVAFSDGSDNFFGGVKFEAGLATSYNLSDHNAVSFNIATRIKQNDTFNGRPGVYLEFNEMAVASVNHNGRVDLGLGAYFTRTFRGGSFRTGICTTLPVGGDRYHWSHNGAAFSGGQLLGEEHTDAFRRGNLIIAIPIIMSMSL